MNHFTSLLVGVIIGFILGVIYKTDVDNNYTAIKLSNVMNASMLQCITDKVITKEQVHDIEVIFHKHIELNFKYIKANQVSYKEKE